MASLKEIRGRIGSIRNIAQITRAMEMMSASRMKRAQDAILAARPYSDELRAALSRVAGAVSEEVDPLLARRPVRRIALIVLTTDRGLAGALDSNTVRAVLRWIASRIEGSGGEVPEVDRVHDAVVVEIAGEPSTGLPKVCGQQSEIDRINSAIQVRVPGRRVADQQ